MGQAQQSRAVLIVEDDAELRRPTAALLEDERVDIIECESAEAGRSQCPRKLTQQAPHLSAATTTPWTRQ
jgi:CheY-like chemotaxis protein